MLKRFFKDIDKGLLPILLTVAVIAFGMSFVLPLIPLVIQDLGAPPSTIGQITSISFTLVTLPIGKWIENAKPKRLIPFLFCFIISLVSIAIMWASFEDTPISKKTSYLGLKELAGVIKIPLIADLIPADEMGAGNAAFNLSFGL
jgi:hypothetical protein